MKNKISIAVLLFTSLSLFGQEKADFYFLETDTTWTKEIFHFPISFAPAINYEGVEDARFPVGWGKKDSSNFWSYAFAWNIKLETEITEKELEDNLQIYFNGLMNRQNTSAIIIKKDDAIGVSRYIGKVKTFDNFFTKEPMALNVLIESYYCENLKKTIILFRFSPKAFGNDVWYKLGEVKLPANICDH